MYYEYWGLKKPPFDNVPDPSMYVESHASLDKAVSEVLFAINEGNECIAVILGGTGLGKTMLLRVLMESLDPDRYALAAVTDPGIPFAGLLREVVGQITGSTCEIKGKSELVKAFGKALSRNHAEGKKIVVFLDEADNISPVNLESLRLLTNMQSGEKNLFTIVMAGRNELARRLEHPRRAGLFQRVGVYCRLGKIGDRDEAARYVKSRLELAGAKRRIFTEEALDILWEHSEGGIPRLINKLAKLSLKAGEAGGLTEIGGEVIREAAMRFERSAEPVLPQRKPRARSAEPAKGGK